MRAGECVCVRESGCVCGVRERVREGGREGGSEQSPPAHTRTDTPAPKWCVWRGGGGRGGGRFASPRPKRVPGAEDRNAAPAWGQKGSGRGGPPGDGHRAAGGRRESFMSAGGGERGGPGGQRGEGQVGATPGWARSLAAPRGGAAGRGGGRAPVKSGGLGAGSQRWFTGPALPALRTTVRVTAGSSAGLAGATGLGVGGVCGLLPASGSGEDACSLERGKGAGAAQ